MLRWKNKVLGKVLLAITIFSAPLAQALAEIAVATVESRQLDTERVLDGQIEAVHQATVSAQTSGRVLEIRFDTGDYVNKGDILIRFRAKDQQAQYDAAKAAYSEALAEFNRIKEVFEKKLVAKAALDKAEAQFKAAKAGLDQATEQLEHTLVRAPYSGIVVKRHIEVGELANVGQKLMTGLSLESLRVIVEVPQGIIRQVQQYRQARVLVDGQSISASKITISPQASLPSHTFTVRVYLPEGDLGVYPGMFTKVAFVTGQEKQLTVPKRCIAYRGDVSAVYLQGRDGKLHLQQVKLGRQVGEDMVVLAGVNDGDTVALDPVQAAAQVKSAQGAE